MEEGQKTKLRLEIAHVLFIDIVGYSKLLIDEQSEVLQELNQIVRKTEAARAAEAAGQLVLLPTGDGMALVFTGSVEDPVECALQISRALHAQPSPLRGDPRFEKIVDPEAIKSECGRYMAALCPGGARRE